MSTIKITENFPVSEFTFKSESNGTVTVKIRSIVIMQGFYSVADAKDSAKTWIKQNVGLTLQY